MLQGVLVGVVNWKVALPAENRSVLLTKQEGSSLLTDITDRELLRGGVDEREAVVLGSELIGMVDTVVAGVAEGRLVGGAEHRGVVLVTHITLDLHEEKLNLREIGKEGKDGGSGNGGSLKKTGDN